MTVDMPMTAPTGERGELTGLLVAARLWATRRPIDRQRVRRALETILLGAHDRYMELVPMYRRLAVELRHHRVNDLETLSRDLLVGAAYFKSYDDTLIPRQDFATLTAWLRDISTLDCRPDLTGVTDLEGWRRALRGVGVDVSLSSGSTGPPSFVPRDSATLSALSNNGRSYSTLEWSWGGSADRGYNCLLLTPPGRRSGIESVAAGLASLARRSRVVTPISGSEAEEAAALAGAEAFVGQVRGTGHRLLVFGTAPAVRWLADTLTRHGRRLPMPDETLLVTGGGWKVAESLEPPGEFEAMVASVLDVTSERTVDVYGLSECNTYLTRCAFGRYHVPPVLGAVVVDDALLPLDGDDVTGQVGLLDPFAFSYPGLLLTGDRARLVQGDCDCGLTGPGFVGRIEREPRHEPKGCAGVAVGVRA
jgi:Acyl-protein synthetase, LuxE